MKSTDQKFKDIKNFSKTQKQNSKTFNTLINNIQIPRLSKIFQNRGNPVIRKLFSTIKAKGYSLVNPGVMCPLSLVDRVKSAFREDSISCPFFQKRRTLIITRICVRLANTFISPRFHPLTSLTWRNTINSQSEEVSMVNVHQIFCLNEWLF